MAESKPSKISLSRPYSDIENRRRTDRKWKLLSRYNEFDVAA